MESPQPQPNITSPGPSWGKLLIGLVVLLVIGVGYGVLAKNYSWWPHDPIVSPTSSPYNSSVVEPQPYKNTGYVYITLPNPQHLSFEQFLEQNYQAWLGTPSQYTDFKINEVATFDGKSAWRFGTERDTYYLISESDSMFLIFMNQSEQ